MNKHASWQGHLGWRPRAAYHVLVMHMSTDHRPSLSRASQSVLCAKPLPPYPLALHLHCLGIASQSPAQPQLIKHDPASTGMLSLFALSARRLCQGSASTCNKSLQSFHVHAHGWTHGGRGDSEKHFFIQGRDLGHGGGRGGGGVP